MTWHATLPKTLLLGGLPIAIVLVTDPKLDERSVHGTWDASNSRIELNEAMPTKEFAVMIFLHELLHALYWFFGMTSKAGEEAVVASLSTGLWMVFHDNPDLVKWIHGDMNA